MKYCMNHPVSVIIKKRYVFRDKVLTFNFIISEHFESTRINKFRIYKLLGQFGLCSIT